MNAARITRIVMSGADKAEAVADGVLKLKSPSEFPICGVEGANVMWMIDESCATIVQTKTSVMNM
jgi:6-phosphogluconolactonase/glucosamine-6-phosphate isomerase/deaminase